MMTIEENLAVAFSRDKRRTLHKGVNKKRKELFREFLVSLHLGLEHRLTAKVGLLSGGERQALSLLMETLTQPKVLLLDEHTAALDPARAQLIAKLTKEVVERSKFTTLMVTHNMQQAIELGNRLIMMDAGQNYSGCDGRGKEELDDRRFIEEVRHVEGSSQRPVAFG